MNRSFRFNLIIFALITFISCEDEKDVIHSFSLGSKYFLLDGKPFQMISGEMHYPRIPKEAWRSRMKAAKAMGINTIGTYVFWNLHEPQQGVYDFSGNNDVAAFIKIAQEEKLWVVLRPSPYVCAEWEFGGYPYWLLNNKELIVRSTEANYLSAYRNYIKEVGKQLAGLQINHGGNILMTQVENEYGFYGDDKEYLKTNHQIFIEAGFDGLLYTSDPPGVMKEGSISGLLPAVNGLDNPEEVKKVINKYHNGKGPYYIAEWYPAWFDSWGAKHHTVDADIYAARLDTVLAAGISINMYMFHGGTTRGFMNGANVVEGSYIPETNSYDYDAPLDEAGNPTEKYMKFRNVILNYLPEEMDLPEVPERKPTIAIPDILLSQKVNLFDVLPAPRTNKEPLTFEKLEQGYGFVLYRTILDDQKSGILKINELRDYGIIFINGKRIGELDRRLGQDSIFVNVPKGKATLDILVENSGRINFGPHLLKNNKGITESVMLNEKELFNWEMYCLPFDDIDQLSFEKKSEISESPVIRKGIINLDEIGDTYLDMSDWGKGCVWVNGHALGRYWEIGPTQTVYVPAEWLKKGINNIHILELLNIEKTQIRSLENPILDVLK